MFAILTDSAASPKETLADALRAAEIAVRLEDKSALAHAALARVHLLTGDHDAAVAEGQAAVALNPSLAVAHYSLGTAHLFYGAGDLAVSNFDRAIRLSPNDPSRWSFFHLKSMSLLEMGEYERALDATKIAARYRPSAFWPHVGGAVALAGLDRLEDARSAVGEARSRNPAFSLAYFARWRRNFHASPFQNFFELLRKAGVPE